MTDRIVVPDHVKFRRESNGGLVYDHENYGYEDATLSTVTAPVIDVLEHVSDAGACEHSTLEAEFDSETVQVLLRTGFLHHE